jgi:hypothetical protein
MPPLDKSHNQFPRTCLEKENTESEGSIPKVIEHPEYDDA